MDQGTYRLKKDNGIHTNNSPLGKPWNKVWDEWKKRNQDATAEDIIKKLDDMAEKAGIEEFRAKSKPWWLSLYK